MRENCDFGLMAFQMRVKSIIFFLFCVKVVTIIMTLLKEFEFS